MNGRDQLAACELDAAEESLRHQSRRDRDTVIVFPRDLHLVLAEYDRRGEQLEITTIALDQARAALRTANAALGRAVAAGTRTTAASAAETGE